MQLPEPALALFVPECAAVCFEPAFGQSLPPHSATPEAAYHIAPRFDILALSAGPESHVAGVALDFDGHFDVDDAQPAPLWPVDDGQTVRLTLCPAGAVVH